MTTQTARLLPARELEALRRLFPVTGRYAYLDHAAIGPLPVPAYEAGQRYLREQREEGYIQEPRWQEALEEARRRAARLVGARAEEMAFVKNTTAGLLLVSNGLRWREGDVVLTVEGEFPANVAPWLNLAGRGVELRFLPTHQGRVRLEEVEQAMDGRVRLLAVSFVEFGTGFRNDLPALGELCRRRGALFCVDAIQGLGALPLDVEAGRIDFLACGGQKWLLGPMGSGLFYCRRDRLDLLGPALLGWYSVQEPDDFFRYDLPLKETSARFEEATPVMGAIHSLGESLGLLLDVGIERIQAHVLALLDLLIEGLERKGYVIGSPVASSGERSGILCLRHPQRAPVELEEGLRAAGVRLSVRGPNLRVSPHVYNAPQEMERLLDALP